CACDSRVLLTLHSFIYNCCIFFFQAEDGIRDATVTGVQTCALPISLAGQDQAECGQGVQVSRLLSQHALEVALRGREVPARAQRSEERRVGEGWGGGEWEGW